MEKDKLSSETIRFLRFPLMVMVVMIHSHVTSVSMGGTEYIFDYEKYPVYSNISFLISEIISRIAVPMFYSISGYLFFNNVSSFSFSGYVKKLRKRTYSLLVPYIFWNLFVILLFYMMQTFLPGLASGANTLIADYRFKDWVQAFWGHQGEPPICYQFWFIRDLMVVVVFSPLVYFLISRAGFVFIPLLCILWLLGVQTGITGFSVDAFFFFSLGTALSVKDIDVYKLLKQHRPLLYTLCCLMILISVLVYNLEQTGIFNSAEIGSVFNGFVILILMGTTIDLVSNGIEKNRFQTCTLLHDSNFFIYAYHAMPLALLIKVLVKVMASASEAALIIIYFAAPAIIIIAGILLFYLLMKLAPRFTSIITGSRA